MELIHTDPKDMVNVKCLITLQQDLLGSEITVTNRRLSSLNLFGSVISHLTVSTPDATYAVGLQGSTYHNKQPFVSDFSIIPPNLRRDNIMAFKGFDALFSSWDKRGKDHEEEGTDEGEEDDDYAQMTEKMCRVYTNAPREFTIMDRVTKIFATEYTVSFVFTADDKFTNFLWILFFCDDETGKEELCSCTKEWI